MTPPGYWHMAIAALASAFAWVESSFWHRLRGDAYPKAYLFRTRDMVLSDPAMSAGPSTPGGWYHTQKNVWPTFLETARVYSGEEMPSKYLGWVGVSAGFMLGSAATALLAVGVIVLVLVL